MKGIYSFEENCGNEEPEFASEEISLLGVYLNLSKSIHQEIQKRTAGLDSISPGRPKSDLINILADNMYVIQRELGKLQPHPRGKDQGFPAFRFVSPSHL